MNELEIWGLIAVSTMNDYQDIIDNLPKPTTDLKEQYLYSIVMAMAGKDYQPFSKPFWRKEQYLKAWWEITTEKLVNNAIISEKIAENTIILSNLSKEVTNLLLTTNHVGIIQQPQINQITESGDTLTLDVLKNKINEIIQLLNNAEVTK